MGSSSPKKQTVGYHYAVGMHLIFCHGKIDNVQKIYVGEKEAWSGTSTGGRVSIDQPNLFGGEDQEGGVVGDVDIEMGASTQTQNDYLVAQLGSDIPAYRKLVGAILRKVRVGTSPYIKPWSFLCKRTAIKNDGSTQWYSAKADISGDLNPAHIIRECLTDEQWGLQHQESMIDDTSFQNAADMLYTENFGLSFVWDSDSTSVEDFIQDVLRHIDGTLYQDIHTGKFKLKLARDDYDPDTLTTYDESEIIEVKDFTRFATGERINQVTVKYLERNTHKIGSITVQDIASISSQGCVVSDEAEYLGISNSTLAEKVAARELKNRIIPLAKLKFVANRKMSGLAPNDLFKWNWSILGINGMVMRVLSVNYGTLQDGRIEIEAIQDIFSYGTSIFSAPATGWSAPISEPAAAPYRKLIEAPYWTVARDVLTSSLVASIDDDAGMVAVSATKPSSDALNYEIKTRTGSVAFEAQQIADWTPTATIGENLPKNIADVEIDLNNIVGLSEVKTGTYAVIGNELVKVKSINLSNGTVTVARAVLDTVPEAHTAGDRIWFIESVINLVLTEYLATEIVDVKCLPITGKGKLAESSAPTDSLTFNSRYIRPYPPSDLKVNSSSYPVSFTGQPTLSWKHRNRVQETVEIVEQTATGVTLETGATYTLKIYNQSNTLVRTETGLTGTSYEYTEANERADCSLSPTDPLNTQLRFELWTVRDGYDSWQKHDITVARS